MITNEVAIDVNGIGFFVEVCRNRTALHDLNGGNLTVDFIDTEAGRTGKTLSAGRKSELILRTIFMEDVGSATAVEARAVA